jgi:hypothetical protein
MSESKSPPAMTSYILNKLSAVMFLFWLPISSYADIYFCQARYYAESNQNFTMTINKEQFDTERSNPKIYSWTVDTQLGISPADHARYKGSCDEDSDLIHCEAPETRLDGSKYFTSLVINKSERLFVVTAINPEYGTGTTTSGTCVKA